MEVKEEEEEREGERDVMWGEKSCVGGGKLSRDCPFNRQRRGSNVSILTFEISHFLQDCLLHS